MGGPLYDTIIRQTEQLDFVRDYFRGTIARDSFKARVDQEREKLLGAGIDEWGVSLLRRMPPDDTRAASQLLAELCEHGIIGATPPREADFSAYQEEIWSSFSHLPDRVTSIFPEEARSAYELSRAIRPKTVVVAGSYYGYLAVWMVPGLAEEGKIFCIDPDPKVSALAKENARSLGFEDRMVIVCDDAISVLENANDDIDLLVVDAYGGRDHPDPRFHGKSIYGPIVKAAMPHFGANATILAHNADRTSADLDEFLGAVAGWRVSIFLDTTEHLAVFRR